MSHHRLKSDELFVNSPLATREQRDKLKRKPISRSPKVLCASSSATTGVDYDDDDQDFVDNARSPKGGTPLRTSLRTSPRKSSAKNSPAENSRNSFYSSPPNSHFKESSPSKDDYDIDYDIDDALINQDEMTSGSRKGSRNRRKASQSDPDESFIPNRRRTIENDASAQLYRRKNYDHEYNEEIATVDDFLTEDDEDDEQPRGKTRYIQPKSPKLLKKTVDKGSKNMKGSKKEDNTAGWCGFLMGFLFILFLGFAAGAFYVYNNDEAFLLVQKLTSNNQYLRLFLNQYKDNGSDELDAKMKWNKTLATWNLKFKNIKKDFPNFNSKHWPVISSGIKRMMKENAQQPGILLLVGSDADTNNCLAIKIVDSVASSINHSDTAGFKRAMTSDMTKEQLFKDMEYKLRDFGSYGLLDIQHLKADTAMTLHAYCDNINAPFKHSAIVMTLKSDQVAESSKPESIAEKLLYKLWLNDLGADKLAALVARIAVSVVQVNPESVPTC